MQHYYDGLEIRPPALRAQQQLDQLNHQLTHVSQYCAGYSSAYRQCRLEDLAELATLPLLDSAELFAAQQAHPPFAGLTGRPASQALRAFASPGQLAIPEYAGADWWGAARALFAAGFKSGEVMLNGHDYHAGPTAFIFDNGARQLGAPVVPCGPHDTQRQLEALQRYQPTGFVGPLVTLLDLLEAAEAAEVATDSLQTALLCEVTHPETAPLQAIYGIQAFNCLVWQDIGVVAYESQPGEGFIVNECCLVEIIDPASGQPVNAGESGQLVVTRLDLEYPLLRLVTDWQGHWLVAPSPCGRTNRRLKLD
ncbi:phenylacetate--CoA ligase family protein [Aeromonas enteropelogenes]|uniref:phenylacetate--CoA ligase family protein n=1 Tax=Aeromonas enteropelogenes TaxID=29489 RepID=UPI0039878DA2